jgi:hypothetical protein
MRVNADGCPYGAGALCRQSQCCFAAGYRGASGDDAGNATPGRTHENLVQIMDEALVRQIGPDIDQHGLLIRGYVREL